MPNLKISPFLIIYVVITVFMNPSYILPTISAIILHELGHILCAKILRAKITRLTLSPLGAQMKLEGVIPYKDELLIAFAGPLFGILGFGFTIFYTPLKTFSIISLILSIFNLLPLPSLDGGRMLKCTLCLFFPLNAAEKISKILGFLTLGLLWAFAIYFMIKLTSGVSVFVFCSLFFSKYFIFNTKKRDLKRFQENN